MNIYCIRGKDQHFPLVEEIISLPFMKDVMLQFPLKEEKCIKLINLMMKLDGVGPVDFHLGWLLNSLDAGVCIVMHTELHTEQFKLNTEPYTLHSGHWTLQSVYCSLEVYISPGWSGVTVSDCFLRKICCVCYPKNYFDIAQQNLAWPLYPPTSPILVVEKLVLG